MIKNYFNDFSPKSFEPDDLLEEWLAYMSHYPLLKTYCIEDYSKDWQKIATEKVFTYDRLSFIRMKEVGFLLEEIIQHIQSKAKEFFDCKNIDDIDWIIYHGLGNGAGGYTSLGDKNVILFGLEKILDLEWDKDKKLNDLVAHEYSHYIHETIRASSLESHQDFKTDMIYRLYVEGLATFGESIMYGRHKSMPDWYDQCLKKEKLLKVKFKRLLNNEKKDILHFFGDWYPVENLIEAGYFLGLRMIEQWLKASSLQDIMKAPYREINQMFDDYMNDIKE